MVQKYDLFSDLAMGIFFHKSVDFELREKSINNEW